MIPFDLHVLSTPPAFVLSQNQTLQKIGAGFLKASQIETVIVSNHSCIQFWHAAHNLAFLFSSGRHAFLLGLPLLCFLKDHF